MPLVSKILSFFTIPVVLFINSAAIFAMGFFMQWYVEKRQRSGEGTVDNSTTGGIDIWHGFEHNVPKILYGAGCKKEFSHYLQGISRVQVNSVKDICNWLAETEYVPDIVQFFKRDLWQHPERFEFTRRGDCEDSALWAWRKLTELGVPCEFMVGIWFHDGRRGAHAWVLFYDDEQIPYILETVVKDSAKMARPLHSVKQNYVPFASVDNNLKKKAYMGLLYWKRRLAGQSPAGNPA